VKYVLDTNTLSFAMAGEPSVSERLLSHARTDVLLPQPVIAEIEYGLARLQESKRPTPWPSEPPSSPTTSIT